MGQGTLRQLTDDTFAEAVEPDGVIAAVEFWATWCMPCKMVEPVIRQLSEEFEGRVIVALVDTDQNRELANRFEINAVPTVVVFRGGTPVKRFVGLHGYDTLASAIEEAIEGAAPSGAAAG